MTSRGRVPFMLSVRRVATAVALFAALGTLALPLPVHSTEVWKRHPLHFKIQDADTTYGPPGASSSTVGSVRLTPETRRLAAADGSLSSPLLRDGGCTNASAALLALRGHTFQYSEVFQGVNRTYWVHLPPGYNATTPLPLVLGRALHSLASPA